MSTAHTAVSAWEPERSPSWRHLWAPEPPSSRPRWGGPARPAVAVLRVAHYEVRTWFVGRSIKRERPRTIDGAERRSAGRATKPALLRRLTATFCSAKRSLAVPGAHVSQLTADLVVRLRRSRVIAASGILLSQMRFRSRRPPSRRPSAVGPSFAAQPQAHGAPRPRGQGKRARTVSEEVIRQPAFTAGKHPLTRLARTSGGNSSPGTAMRKARTPRASPPVSHSLAGRVEGVASASWLWL